jgi:4-nitrophenyl phosphatase
MTDLSWVQGFIIDMDGVLWRGRDILPGVQDFFRYMESHHLSYVLATNNATATPEQFAQRLSQASVDVSIDHILTSALATASYIKHNYPELTRVLAIGDTGLRTALTEAGMELVDQADQAQAVVVGMDMSVNWDQLAEATLAIRDGARFIGTNPDPSFPNERGQVPGNGAILAALEAASNQQPLVIGKPETHLYEAALDIMGVPAENTLVIGDRLETDIQGGINLGAATALLLTGVTDHQTAKDSPIKPNFTFDNLRHLQAALEGKD